LEKLLARLFSWAFFCPEFTGGRKVLLAPTKLFSDPIEISDYSFNTDNELIHFFLFICELNRIYHGRI
ncbi:hypothetical protein, partial [Paraglaciecola sp. 20A4]|uniref:hypothetical protein n=1 Tax=Paraglaciecola sp. 20A4 TaxID=2687288 RepID=UPI00197DC4BF